MDGWQEGRKEQEGTTEDKRRERRREVMEGSMEQNEGKN